MEGTFALTKHYVIYRWENKLADGYKYVYSAYLIRFLSICKNVSVRFDGLVSDLYLIFQFLYSQVLTTSSYYTFALNDLRIVLIEALILSDTVFHYT